MSAPDAGSWLAGDSGLTPPTQIGEEIRYFRDFYGELKPTVFLSYEREAFCSLDGSDFRITLDENILARDQDLDLCSEAYGTSILQPELTLLEVKAPGAIPLWLTTFLSENKIYKTSFSKYGTAYRTMLFKGGKLCV